MLTTAVQTKITKEQKLKRHSKAH